MCLIVTIDGLKYQVDVGFGGDAAMQPIPLRPGVAFPILAPRRGRLEYRSIDQHSDPTQRLWVYSTQDTPATPWVEQYCFVELEYLPADYNVMNYYAGTNPASFFASQLLAMRAELAEEEEGVRLAGVVTFFRGEVRRRAEGSMERQVLETVATEGERVAALQRWFRIPMTEEERESIYSTGLALPR